MASLTEISILSRKGVRYGIYLLILLLLARTTINLVRVIYLRIFPPAPPESTVVFGKLPRIPFPEKTPKEREQEQTLTYKIETADGKFPLLDIQQPVYAMPAIPQNINALDDAKNNAQRLDFLPSGRPILESTPNIYVFQKRGAPATLTMNIITGIFSIFYDIAQDPTVLTGAPIDPERGSEQINTYLSGAGLLPEDLAKGRKSTQFFKNEGNVFVEVDSLSEANFTKINVFRKNYGLKEDIISVTPEMPEANVWFLVGSNIRQVVRAEYHYYPIDASKNGTYPLKTSEQAWEDLKSNKGFIVNSSKLSGNEVTVRKISLAYYDAGQFQEYYQPVVVFEGDNDFLAYVPAVTEDFYGAEIEQP